MNTSIRELLQAADRDERHSLLEELVNVLQFEDRQALSGLISRKNDPLVRLPVELVLHVFAYLPISYAWRLQQVCKSWRHVLSSESFQRCLLAPFEYHDPAYSARPSGWAASQSVQNKLRHILAWRGTVPLSEATISRDCASHEDDTSCQAKRTVALHRTCVAYLHSKADEGDVIVVHDLLSSRPDLHLRPEGRDRIMTLVLSENLVACITFSAKLYVQALDDEGGSQKTIRLPSAAVSTFHADGNCLALTTTDYSGSTSLLLIYDHLTRRAVQHTVEHPRAAVSENCTLNSVTFAAEMHRPTSYEWSGPSSVLVGEEQGTFDLFYESYGESTPGTDEHQVYRVHLVHQRYHISPASAQLPHLFHKQSEQILLLLTTPFLTSMDLGRRICILGAPRPTGSPGQWYFGRYLLDVNQAERWSSHHVPTFDAATGVLSTNDYYLPTSPRKKPNPGRLMTNSRITQLYSIEGYKHQIHPLLNTFSIGGTHSCAAVRTSGVFDEEVFDQEVFDQESHIQGVEMNDSFQIMSLRKGGRDSIRVWCFEPGLHWKSDRTTRVRGNDLRRLCVNILRRV